MAFVPPRYGLGAVGGSEAVSREMALGLARRGWDVEVLTTCAVDHYTWENALEPGVSEEEGVVVRRFRTVRSREKPGIRVEGAIARGEPVPFDAQISWTGARFRVPDLFHHLVRRGDDYDAVVLSPYLFWTTVATLPAVAGRAVVMPCLHDEPYAHLEVIRPVLRDPALVWFLSEPEHELAHRLGEVAPRHAVVGAGVDVPAGYDPEGFRRRHGLHRPFLLYAGRREEGKGWYWLLDRYREALECADVDVDLVTVGVGDAKIPASVADRVHDLGFLETAERDDALAAATGYVQPSLMESFSRTIMEAWLAGTPVLARAEGEVVAWHCRRSGGGLLFGDAAELAGALRRLAADPAEAAALGARGRQYVVDNYSWEAVLDRVEGELESLR